MTDWNDVPSDSSSYDLTYLIGVLAGSGIPNIVSSNFVMGYEKINLPP